MTADDAACLYQQITAHGVPIWIDGGWGVDALLGRVTRAHDDIDIVVEHQHLDRLVGLLSEQGFVQVPRDDTRAWNFVMGDTLGREVDVHVIRIDRDGDGIYGPPENGECYPAESLTGSGTLRGLSVRCISVRYQLVSHTGYRVQDKDIVDVRNLCSHFGLEPPVEYRDLG